MRNNTLYYITGGKRTPLGYKRGTLFCYNAEASASQITCSEHVVTEVTQYPGQRAWINWAIGGLSLHVRKNLGKAEYYAKVTAEESPAGIGSFGSGIRRAHTFIGYKPVNGDLWDTLVAQKLMKSGVC